MGHEEWNPEFSAHFLVAATDIPAAGPYVTYGGIPDFRETITKLFVFCTLLCKKCMSFLAAISKNVDTIVAGIESGKKVTEYAPDAFEPYAFIMEENGKMLVHPSLTGESLAEKAPPVYQALLAATPEGIWVQYEWKGKTKHTYAKKTKDNLIVGSGY